MPSRKRHLSTQTIKDDIFALVDGLTKDAATKNLETLAEYIHWLKEAIQLEPDFEIATSREVVAGSRQTLGTWTVQQEYVKCGKPRCKNDRHGPYWYGYQKQAGKLKSKYIGKTLKPEAITGEKQETLPDIDMAAEVAAWKEAHQGGD